MRHIGKLGIIAFVALAATMALSMLPVIAAEPAAAPALATSPLTYDAISDTKYYPKPELPKLGPAGFLFRDPTFGCPILRVSDEKTHNGNSIMTPASAEHNVWNTDSTLFCLHSSGMWKITYRFDPKTMKASRIQDLPALPNMGEVEFSYHDPNLLWGTESKQGKIVQFNFSTGKAADVLDVGKLTGLPLGHMGAFTLSANDIVALTFGGKMQDLDPYLLVYNTKDQTHHLWNTQEGSLDGKPLSGAPKFTQHNSTIDRRGRYITAVGPGVNGPVILDLEKATVLQMTARCGGHRVMGYGDIVNDEHIWLYRTLDPGGINGPKELMKHPAGEPYFAYDSHVSWNNTKPRMKVPVVLSTYHDSGRPEPKCIWGDEIIAVATDGSGTVWRFAHHRSTIGTPGKNDYNFWDTPRGNVSQDGWFFMFTSNWEDNCGKDRTGRFRDDVFIVKLEKEGAVVPSTAPSK